MKKFFTSTYLRHNIMFIKTINCFESPIVHTIYNVHLNCVHPLAFVVITTLMNTQAETVTELSTIFKQINNSRNKKKKE